MQTKRIPMQEEAREQTATSASEKFFRESELD
jgi:hypothetical protein